MSSEKSDSSLKSLVGKKTSYWVNMRESSFLMHLKSIRMRMDDGNADNLEVKTSMESYIKEATELEEQLFKIDTEDTVLSEEEAKELEAKAEKQEKEMDQLTVDLLKLKQIVDEQDNESNEMGEVLVIFVEGILRSLVDRLNNIFSKPEVKSHLKASINLKLTELNEEFDLAKLHPDIVSIGNTLQKIAEILTERRASLIKNKEEITQSIVSHFENRPIRLFETANRRFTYREESFAKITAYSNKIEELNKLIRDLSQQQNRKIANLTSFNYLIQFKTRVSEPIDIKETVMTKADSQDSFSQESASNPPKIAFSEPKTNMYQRACLVLWLIGLVASAFYLVRE